MVRLTRAISPRRSPNRPAPHGGLPVEQLLAMGIDPTKVLDFSVSTNPFGPSPKVLAAILTIDITRYPDPSATILSRSLSNASGVSPDQILTGNGAVELIWLTARAYLGPGDTALVIGPTFGEYAQAARAAGAEVATLNGLAANGFVLDLAELDAMIEETSPQVTYLCNPNNPTGVYLPPEALQPIFEGHPETLFVIDEAYLWSLPSSRVPCSMFHVPNVLTVRSMTKDCATPGLRLGYAVGSENVIDALRGQQPPWSVNALAQAAGVAALSDSDHLERSLIGIQEAKAYLVEALTEIGLPPLPSETNFLLLHVDDGLAFQQQLLQQGCYVRDCASFGLLAYVRIGVRTLPECERLAAAIQGVRK